MKNRHFLTFVAINLFLANTSIKAQQLILDNSFSDDGIQTTSLAPLDCHVESIAIQSDGKPILAGWTYELTNSDFVVARYNIDGTPDVSWGVDGIVTTDFNSSFDQAQAIKIQTDGKIVVVGFSDSKFALARYNTDGSLDNSFNLTGKKIADLGATESYAYGAEVQPDGKIIAVGFAIYGNVNMAIARFTTTGELDVSFSGDGVQLTDFTIGEDKFWNVLIQPDNKIVAVGQTADLADINFAAVRYNSDGSLDNTFGIGGRMSDYFIEGDSKCYSVALDADNNILLGGNVDGKFGLERITSTGEPDYTFGTWGQVVTSIGYSIESILVRDEKIYVAGSKSSQNCIARFDNTGEIDLTFDTDGFELSNLVAGSGIKDMKFNIDGDIIAASASPADLSGVLTVNKYTYGDDVAIFNNILPVTPFKIAVYPTIITETLNVSLELTSSEIVNIWLYDIFGNQIENFLCNEKCPSGSNNFTFYPNKLLQVGVYYVAISTPELTKFATVIRM